MMREAAATPHSIPRFFLSAVYSLLIDGIPMVPLQFHGRLGQAVVNRQDEIRLTPSYLTSSIVQRQLEAALSIINSADPDEKVARMFLFPEEELEPERARALTKFVLASTSSTRRRLAQQYRQVLAREAS